MKLLSFLIFNPSRNIPFSLRLVDGLRNSNGIELRNFHFTTVWKFYKNFSLEVEKCIIWGSIQAPPNKVSKKSFHTFEDIDLRELMQNYIKTE